MFEVLVNRAICYRVVAADDDAHSAEHLQLSIVDLEAASGSNLRNLPCRLALGISLASLRRCAAMRSQPCVHGVAQDDALLQHAAHPEGKEGTQSKAGSGKPGDDDCNL